MLTGDSVNRNWKVIVSGGLSVESVINYIFKNIAENKISNQEAKVMISELQDMKKNAKEGIAIIGMSCKFPEANNISEYWAALINEKNCIRTFPEQRRVLPKELNLEHLYSDGGFLDEIDKFDAAFFRVSPKEAKWMSPNQRLMLETAWTAVEDSGYGPDKLFGTNTGVYIGHDHLSGKDYRQYCIDADETDPLATIGSYPGILAGRISYALNLKGPSIVIDTACSSGLVAVHNACEAIRNKECNMAIAGGVFIRAAGLNDAGMSVVDEDGCCHRSFDERAFGMISGEGVAAVILKPVSKAVKDGDHIYGVIKGSAINNDGASSGMTAPSAEAQEELIERVWKNLQLNPENIAYIEAQGSGTKIGDAIEITALTNAFRKFTQKRQFCMLGTVKPNVGHLVSSSGMASLIKVALCLEKKKIPATINFQVPNSHIGFCESPIFINDRLREWEKGDVSRIACINAFGFSGTNCHMVLENAPEIDREECNSMTNKPSILVLSAKDTDVLATMVRNYEIFLDQSSQIEMEDLCYTANTGRGHYECRLAIIANGIRELKEKLSAVSKEGLKSGIMEGIFFGVHKIATISIEKNANGIITESEKQRLSKSAYSEAKAILQHKENHNDVLNIIGNYYVRGATINWEELLFVGRFRKKVSLPTYPFKRTRYWSESKIQTNISGFSNAQSGDKDILDSKTQVPMKESMNVLLAGRSRASEYTDLELKLGQIWSETLGHNEINIYENFYELGGTSISLINLTTRIRAKFGIDIGLSNFLKEGSIFKIASLISDGGAVKCSEDYIQWEHDPDKLHEPFPLTQVQMAYFIGRNSEVELGGVAAHVYTEYRTNLDIPKLNCSLQKVIERHPMLRAVFLADGRQKIMEYVPAYEIQVTDISNLSEDEQNKCIVTEREKLSHHIFNPEIWPLFEFKSYKLSEEVHYLFVGFDMLIADGASMGIVSREIDHFYNNPDKELPLLDFTFRDYILAHSEFRKSNTYLKAKEYWLGKLKNFPTTPALPLIQSLDSIGKPHFKRYREIMDAEKYQMLKKASQQNNLSISTLLCTLYSEVLAFWSNQYRFAISLTVFSRYPFNEKVNEVIGDFTSVILLEINLQPNTTIWERAKQIQNVIMESLENRHFDGVELIREISKANSLGNKAVMPVVFNSMIFNSNDIISNTKNSLGEVVVSLHQTPQVYLENQVSEKDGSLSITWDYIDQVFDEYIIDSMFKQYIELINGLADPQYQHNLQPVDGDRLILEEYNKTEDEISGTTLHEMFINQVRRDSNNVAVEYENRTLTYAELHNKSNQIAHYLKQQDIGRNDLVAVVAKRSEDTIVNILGILKAGAAYVPIEPDYPQERKEYIISNSNCKMMLDSDLYVNKRIKEYPITDIFISNQEDVAYVIYTSGSTGKPKGVVITHNAAANTIIDINRKFNVSEKDRIMGISSMCFDLSVYDIFGALSTGATLVMIHDQRDIKCLMQAVYQKEITVWNSVPAIMGMLIENMNYEAALVNRNRETDQSNMKNERKLRFYLFEKAKEILRNLFFKKENHTTQKRCLRLVMLSGDWIPLNLPGKIREMFANINIISLGGATEASIWSIYYPVTEIDKNWSSIPYGMPLANQKIYVMNNEMEQCPIGVQGELYIGGIGVAKGYINDEEKTKASFIHHSKYGYLYKTGDYGLMHTEGYAEFLGRQDDQVKIKGYRIELGEIESKLNKHNQIVNSVVNVYTNDAGKKYLSAYIVAEEKISVSELRAFLAEELPGYMIPTYFIFMENFPLTFNGKLDKKMLPKPSGDIEMENAYKDPVNQIEEKLVVTWKAILKIEKIGTLDDFFELGGDSLAVGRLAAKIKSEFNIDIPLNLMFTMTTIQGIAQYIEENGSMKAIQVNNTVLLKKGTDVKKNVFFVHAGSGDIEVYIELSNRLKTDYNYWGIRRDRLKGLGPENVTVEEFASKYITEIKAIQPEGPYHLSGWCVGGTIAFEIARQLEREKQHVEFLALINSAPPQRQGEEVQAAFTTETELAVISQNLPKRGFNGYMRYKARNLKDMDAVWERFVDFTQKANVSVDMLREQISSDLARIIPNFNQLERNELVYYTNLFRSNNYSRSTYIPQSRINARVHFIEANLEGVSDKGIWNNYCYNAVKVYNIDGDHLSLLRLPDVDGVSEIFNTFFNII